ncbi:MAG TPA: DUF58 domain-containing protein [Trichocoleus sp.]
MLQKTTDWLETHWVAPAYVGWVLMGLAAFFFAAATNTLAGWLYVMSGVLLGLLTIAAILPARNLTRISIERQPIRPVSAGEALLMELALTNDSRQAKALLQVWDELPAALSKPQQTAIAAIAPGHLYRWIYEVPAQRRGIYHWQTVALRTAAPLGLFWCRRSQTANASATVYPQILPLTQCPLLDTVGQESGFQWHQNNAAQLATEGITRSLRPYRWGDSTRLIHWRTSARYGELRVRELEKITASQQVIIALNTADTWEFEAFEQAVIAAASLYIYALRRGFAAALWTPPGQLVREKAAVLSVLAAIAPTSSAPVRPRHTGAALIWLSYRPQEKAYLPNGSQQICWTEAPTRETSPALIRINSKEALQPQLQAARK